MARRPAKCLSRVLRLYHSNAGIKMVVTAPDPSAARPVFWWGTSPIPILVSRLRCDLLLADAHNNYSTTVLLLDNHKNSYHDYSIAPENRWRSAVLCD